MSRQGQHSQLRRSILRRRKQQLPPLRNKAALLRRARHRCPGYRIHRGRSWHPHSTQNRAGRWRSRSRPAPCSRPATGSRDCWQYRRHRSISLLRCRSRHCRLCRTENRSHRNRRRQFDCIDCWDSIQPRHSSSPWPWCSIRQWYRSGTFLRRCSGLPPHLEPWWPPHLRARLRQISL